MSMISCLIETICNLWTNSNTNDNADMLEFWYILMPALNEKAVMECSSKMRRVLESASCTWLLCHLHI